MTVSPDAMGILKIDGVLDIEAAGQLRAVLLNDFTQHPAVTVDLSGIEICDAAALQVLISAQATAAHLGKPFLLAGVSEPVADVATELGWEWA